MAVPDTDLTSDDDMGGTTEATSTFGDDEERIRHESGSIANPVTKSSHGKVLDQSSPIIYQYLTFETPLPLPSRRNLSNHPEAPAPTQPDLKKYTSPFEWSESRKNFTIWLSCIATLITAYTAGSYAPPSAQMAAEWHVSEVAIVVGITTFCAGFAMCVTPPHRSVSGPLIPWQRSHGPGAIF